VHLLKAAGKENRDAQSTDGAILSEKTSNHIPSKKRTLGTGLGGEA